MKYTLECMKVYISLLYHLNCKLPKIPQIPLQTLADCQVNCCGYLPTCKILLEHFGVGKEILYISQENGYYLMFKLRLVYFLFLMLHFNIH